MDNKSTHADTTPLSTIQGHNKVLKSGTAEKFPRRMHSENNGEEGNKKNLKIIFLGGS